MASGPRHTDCICNIDIGRPADLGCAAAHLTGGLRAARPELSSPPKHRTSPQYEPVPEVCLRASPKAHGDTGEDPQGAKAGNGPQLLCGD